MAATLVLAAVCWAVLATQATGMGMGLAALPAFMGMWVVMTTAMMLPSAAPLAAGYASTNVRALWPPSLALVGVAYLSVWAIIGLAAYVASVVLPNGAEMRLAGASLVIAGLYGLTPVQRWFRARCRTLCSAAPAVTPLKLGVEYGLNCVGCSGGLMLVVVLLGMDNLAWMATLGAVLLLYKVAPVIGWLEIAIASALVAAGLALIV